MTLTVTAGVVPPDARPILAARGLVNPELVRYDDLTAPSYALALADKVELVDRYTVGDDWTVTLVEELGAAWVLRWDRLTLALRDRSDLELARFVVAERLAARKHLRRTVLDTVRALGLPAGPFYHPPAPKINAGLTKCPGCGANVRAGQHAPGSEDCHETRRERLYSMAD